jgi:uncharacterized protein (UPF0261 family)
LPAISASAAAIRDPFIGMKDVMLVHSVVDILGLNAFLEDILVRSVTAFSALVAAPQAAKRDVDLPCIGMTTFGSTTQGAGGGDHSIIWKRLASY